VEFPIRISFITSQDYQTRWCHTKKGNLSGHAVRAITRTVTPTTLANLSHNLRVPHVHLPYRATTQEVLMFIRHLEPQLKRCHSEPQLKECHVLNPHPEPQLKGYIPSHNSRNTSKPTFEISPKPCRPRIYKISKAQFLPLQYRHAYTLLDHLAGDTCRQAPSASEPTDLHTSPSGTTFTTRRYSLQNLILLVAITWWVNHHRQVLHQYLHSTGLSLLQNICTHCTLMALASSSRSWVIQTSLWPTL